VSIDYIVRLEQGRGPRPSAEVLGGLARALRLSDDERAYLFDLAGRRDTGGQPAAEVAQPLMRLVGDLSPLPAMVGNYRFDILAWTPERCRVRADSGARPPRLRNPMWLCLRDPALADFYCDRERIIREGIADLRAAWAAHPDDVELAELIARLRTGSEDFAR